MEAAMNPMSKPLAIAALSIAMLAPAEAADSVPVKFQGTWIMEKGNGPWSIGAKTVDFGSGFKSEITSVQAASEDGDEIVVTRRAQGGDVKEVLRLARVNGAEVLVQVNVENPAGSIFISRRKRN
jgi:hypothetical protein